MYMYINAPVAFRLVWAVTNKRLSLLERQTPIRVEIIRVTIILFWSSGHALALLVPERFYCPALSFCGVSCML